MRNNNIKLKIVIYILVTLGFVYIWVKLINFNDFIKLILNTNYYLIFTAILVNLFQSYLSSIRVRYLFLSIGAKLKIFDIWTGGWISSLITSFLPFYSGGFLYALLLSKKGNISYKKSFTILLIDFIMATFNILTIFASPFIKLKEKKYFIRASILSFVTFLIGILTTYIYFMAFGIYPAIYPFIIAHIVFVLAGLVPGVPLRIGQYELTGVLVYQYFFNIDTTSVSAIFGLQHLVSLILVSIVGAFCAYVTKYEFKK